MRHAIVLFMAFLLCFAIGSCNTDTNEKGNKRPVRSYYFPLEKLDGGMMFAYTYKNHLMPDFFWHLTTTHEQDALYLNIVALDGGFNVTQRIKEQIYPSGSVIVDYRMYNVDTLTGQPVEASLNIKSGVAFPFEVQPDGGVYIFQASWVFPNEPEVKYTLIRNKRYAGDTTFIFKGRSVPAIRFDVKELIETEVVGFQEIEFNKVEVYAKGLGLVSSKTILNDSLDLEYYLTDTIHGSLLPVKNVSTQGK